MERLNNSIISLFPTVDRLLAALDIELQRAVLRFVAEATDDRMRGFGITRDGVVIALFGHGGYEADYKKRQSVERVISRAWKALEDLNFIEEPDPANGKNRYRVISSKGRAALAGIDFAAAKARTAFIREMFHPSLPDAAWHAFSVGDYDTAVFEAFKAVEAAVLKKGMGRIGITQGDYGVALMRKAFDSRSGPLTDMSARPPPRRDRRCELFTGAFGELRNPKAHGDSTITDTLVAVEEMMTASTLQRIVDNA